MQVRFLSCAPEYASLAQTDRASDYESEGPRFKPWKACQFVPVAESVDASVLKTDIRVIYEFKSHRAHLQHSVSGLAVKAPDCGSGNRQFESALTPHIRF